MINNRDTRWVTPAIKILYDLKKDYYVLNQQYNNQILNDRYKFICKTLKKKHKDTKRSYLNTQITNSTNIIKTT